MTGWAEDLLLGGGYVLLALLILLENLFPPIPSELLLPLAGSRVASGDFDYLPAVAAATVGSVVGALILYALGRIGGRPVLLRHGRLLRLPGTLRQHTHKVVLLGRMVPGVRSVVSIPAGLSEMPVGRFVALTALGSVVWNAALIGGGWALGSRWRDATHLIESIDIYLYIAVAAGVLLAFGIARSRRRRATRRR